MTTIDMAPMSGDAQPGLDLDGDYTADLAIAAAPETVFDALTTLTGLATWWSTVSGSGLPGGELRFTFGDPTPCTMQVTRAERPGLVEWLCLGYDPLPDWAGTTIHFSIEPGPDGGSRLAFRHAGLTPRLECWNDCRSGWDEALSNLRVFAETGAVSR